MVTKSCLDTTEAKVCLTSLKDIVGSSQITEMQSRKKQIRRHQIVITTTHQQRLIHFCKHADRASESRHNQIRSVDGLGRLLVS